MSLQRQYINLKNVPVEINQEVVVPAVPSSVRFHAECLPEIATTLRSQNLLSDVAVEVLPIIVSAHLDTCPFTHGTLANFLTSAHQQAQQHSHSNGYMSCPLNPIATTNDAYIVQDFSSRFSPAIRGVVEFAKRLPAFSTLIQEDQATLLKAGVFEVLLLRLAGLFDPKVYNQES
jgi:hypothetical protein